MLILRREWVELVSENCLRFDILLKVKDAAACLHQAMKGLNVHERLDKISNLPLVAWASNLRNEYFR